MTIWFTSDWHLGHANIIEYSNRPFKSTKEMDRAIINSMNSYVKHGDTVFHLGDVVFKGYNISKLQKELNGHYIFIQGNHDHKKVPYEICELVLDTKIGAVLLVHDPRACEETIDRNIVGHVHEKWKTKKVRTMSFINVGVDVWDFKPVPFNTIISLFKEMEE